MRRCAMCCRTSRPPMTRNTARRFAAARASSGRWTAKRAWFTCCGSTSSSGWKAPSPPLPSRSSASLPTWKPRSRRIEAQAEAVEEIDIEDVDVDDPAFESLLVGRKVKVLLAGRGPRPLAAGPHRGPQPPGHAAFGGEPGDAPRVTPSSDRLREVIEHKCPQPDQSRQPQVPRLHRLCRHRPVSLS